MVRGPNLGFLLAKASQRWNGLLAGRLQAAGFPEVRPAYGSVLVPLFEEDRLRMGELARRSRLTKQTMTTLVRLAERDGLVRRERDPADRRAFRVCLTNRARASKPAGERALAGLDRLVSARLSTRGVRELKTALRVLADL